MKRDEIAAFLSKAFEGFGEGELPAGTSHVRGKVRDIVDLGSEMIITTTDRISAFDRVLTTIPCKGEVLNGMSNYWFDATSDIVGNHIVDRLTARSVRVRRCEVLPVEVVVRGYLTGSAWRDYQAGKGVSGIKLPTGMRFNQRFEKPLLTPSTKAERGLHDEPISPDEILEKGIVPEKLWREVERTAFELFARGTEMVARNGLLLVDTKYEFGLLDGKLTLVDEVHTPDSSRFWFSDSYDSLYRSGEKQRKIDKEYLRQWLMEQGFMGDGEPPAIPDEIRVEVAWRYIQAYQLITGKEFTPAALGVEAERDAILSAV